jgi:hypothetical protein
MRVLPGRRLVQGNLLKDAAFHPSKCKIGNAVLCRLLLLAGPVFVEDIVYSAHYETYCLLEIEIVNLNTLLRTIVSIINQTKISYSALI